jgi:hypothetical protein
MRIALSGQTFTFPNNCVCCGGPANTVLHVQASKSQGKRVIRTTTRGWDFPYCSLCSQHLQSWKSASGYAWLTFFCTGIGGYFLVSVDWVAVVVAASAALALILFWVLRSRARKHCSTTCVCAGPAAYYLGWHGTQHEFEIVAHSYAVTLAASNERKLINVSPELHALLRTRSLLPPVIVPPALPAHPAQMDDELIVKCLAKLESAKGPATRRNILRAALPSLSSDAARQHLLLEASRIEVDAVLGKVDTLKTTSSKRRALTTAIEEIKSDAIADELQRTQLRLLGEALAELETTTSA